MPTRTKRREDPQAPWRPSRPVPWPDTGDPHLDLLRAAVEARLYPYGDLVSSPGRCISSHQLSLLARGQADGMDDRQVSDFLSANLACGGNSVYRRVEDSLVYAGSVVLSGRWDPPDAMGRRDFYWTLTIEPPPGDGAAIPAASWERVRVCDAFRRAFAVPAREVPRADVAEPRWENLQALLF